MPAALYSGPSTLIVGAGPAGLATGACLARLGERALLLERGEVPGWAWHRHYAALRLHTTRRDSALPFAPWPRGVDRYPSRADFAAYLARYAERFALDVRCGQEVQRVRRAGDEWEAETAAATHRARHLVIATGFNGVPRWPELPGRESFAGELLHSASYCRAETFHGRRVLVVGLGNSGADIAADLHAGGAQVTLSVRGPVHFVPRDLWGINWHRGFALCPRAVMAAGKRLGKHGRALASRLAGSFWAAVQERRYGDLRLHGLPLQPAGAILQHWLAQRTPLTAEPLVELVRCGAIAVRPEVEELQPHGARFVDGGAGAFDAVILATGFGPWPGTLFESGDDADLGRGTAPTATAGLHFAGCPPLLREITRAARRTARTIHAAERRYRAARLAAPRPRSTSAAPR